MRLVESNDVVQQLAAAATNPALSGAILPRAADHRPNCRDVHRANGGGHFVTILGIVVEDEELCRRLVGKGFAQLLHDPGAGGMPSDVEVQNAPPIMANDKEDV